MDIITIETRSNREIILPDELLSQLPQEIILFTTVQFLNSIEKIKQQLKEKNISVKTLQPRHCKYECQMLGCSTQKLPIKGDVLYIGDGLFHPKALLIKNQERKIYTFNPKTNDVNILTKTDSDTLPNPD